MRKSRLISMTLVFVFAFALTQVSFAAPKNFALKFDGQKDDGATGTRIIVDHSEELNLADKLTIEAWIYATALDKNINMITGKTDTLDARHLQSPVNLPSSGQRRPVELARYRRNQPR